MIGPPVRAQRRLEAGCCCYYWFSLHALPLGRAAFVSSDRRESDLLQVRTLRKKLKRASVSMPRPLTRWERTAGARALQVSSWLLLLLMLLVLN